MNHDQIPAGAIKPCGSCARPIVLATTADGAKLPVELEETTTGNVRLALTDTGKAVTARVLPAKLAFGATGLHLSHFAHCPNAAAHRRRPTRRRTP